MRLGKGVAPVGFPNIGLQGFAPKVLAHGHKAGRNRGAVRRGDDARYFQSLSRRPPFRCNREIPAARWWIELRRDALGKSLTFLLSSFAANTSHEENSNGTCGARPSERCRKT